MVRTRAQKTTTTTTSSTPLHQHSDFAVEEEDEEKKTEEEEGLGIRSSGNRDDIKVVVVSEEEETMRRGASSPPSAAAAHDVVDSPYSSGSSWSSPRPNTVENGKDDDNNNNTKTASSEKSPTRTAKSVALSAVRAAVADLPVLVLFAALCSTYVVEKIAYDYLVPQMDLQAFDYERRENELTYYHRKCSADDLTARDAPELVVDYDAMTTDDAVRHMNRHGVQVYPDLLSESTANEIRDFILTQNEKNEGMIDVIENENRWSFYMRVDQHPSVNKALKEVLSNQFLVDAIDEIIGYDPAVIEFTGITSAYGAATQRYHADVVPEGNGAKWARNFVPSWSLFIPLQNITAEMGATDICPGSHMCAEGCFDYCATDGFQVSGSQNNWPLGWGALVNQQTFHRGAEHKDPNGPHRALFIITFAPRPRFGERQVETRMIGQGGSYSLHWTQWGHTLRDFRDSDRRMRQPWRTLRSFGLYKPADRRWGWDWFTESTGRIANDELGFYWTDLVKMMDEGGLPFIPKHLQAEIPPEDDSSRTVWMKFYSDTLELCRAALVSAYTKVLVAYLCVVVGGSCFFFASPTMTSRRRFAVVGAAVVRLLAIHAFVLGASWFCISRVQNSTWGKNIAGGRAFRWPDRPHLSSPVVLDAATLPTVDDIMVFDDMQSEYLASFNQVLDIFHDGNRAWFELLGNNSAGYSNLPSLLQTRVCESLLDQVQNRQGRRILVKNDLNQWARADDDRALRFCHKEMMKLSSPTMKKVIRQLDFQWMETKFGYWRNAAMHSNCFYIPSLLLRLQDKVMRFARTPSPNKGSLGQQPVSSPASSKNLFPLRVTSSIEATPVSLLSTNRALFERHSSILSEPERPETWIEEGDDVEAAYGQLMTGASFYAFEQSSLFHPDPFFH